MRVDAQRNPDYRHNGCPSGWQAYKEMGCAMTRAATILMVAAIVFSAAAVTSAQDTLRDLSSPDWTVRAKAVRVIAKTPSLLTSADVRTALISLQNVENHVIEDAARSGTDVSTRFGEGYTEYYFGPLCDTMIRLATEGDVRAAEALARGSYNPDSAVALMLAAYGERLVPTMLQVARSDLAPNRWNGVAVLGQMLRLQRTAELRPALRSATESQVKKAIRDVALSDSQPTARRWAVRALGVAGDTESLSLLETIAATDPDDGRGHTSKVDYSVRAEARRAIAAIKAIR